MSGNPFKIVVSGEDKGILKLLQRVQVEFENIDAPVRKTGDSLRKTSNSSGLSEFRKQLVSSKDAALDMASGIERILPPVATLAGFATAGGIADLAYKFAGAARQIQLTQKYTDLSTNAIQRWIGMAEAAGVPGSAMNNTMNAFAQNIEGAVYGRNMDLKQFSVRMGVDLGTPGSVRGVDDVLKQVAEAISTNPDPKIKTAIISAFGLDEIKAFLIDGEAGLKRYSDMVDRSGIIQSPEQIERAANFNRTLIESRMAIEGLGNSIGSALVPVLEPLLVDFNKWVELNREFISLRIKNDVIEIKDALIGVAHAVDTGVDAVGGWHNVFRGLEIYIAGSFLASVTATIMALNATFIKTPLGRLFLIGMAAGYAVDKAEGAAPGITPYLNAFPDAATWLARKGYEGLTGNTIPENPANWPSPGAPDARLPQPDSMMAGPYSGNSGGSGQPASVHVVRFENAPPGTKVIPLSQNNKDSVLKILHSMPPGVAN